MSSRIIAGRYKGIKLQGVESDRLKPTTSKVRETLFNICQNEIGGAIFLDLFAGIGAIGIEAFSRGAEEVFFVEKERRHAEAIRANIGLCEGKEHCHLIVQDVFKAIDYFVKKGVLFDIVFADPPYGTKVHSLSNELLKKIDEGEGVLKKGGRLFLEDHVDASEYREPLRRLKVQKVRSFGKICLREFS